MPTHEASCTQGSAVASRLLREARSSGSQSAIALRRAVHRLGLRYRVAARPLPEVRRVPDFVFPHAKVAVFLDGCFWHGCPAHATVSEHNDELWAAKVAQNGARDKDTDQRLQDAGWVVVRVWEHENPQAAAERVRAVLQGRR
ncbi:very short patch repair endonuclease [Streptomyces sp. NPDC000941]